MKISDLVGPGIRKILISGIICTIMFYRIAIAAEGETPQELNREAYLRLREARAAVYQGNEARAYAVYLEALSIYEKIARLYPSWSPEPIRSNIIQCRTESDRIGRKIFQIPEGYIELKPGMPREGNRYGRGRSLASRVSRAGQNDYRVEDYTVTIFRQGPLLGAACTCPDFKYRGAGHGYACKHIWAVVIKEGLLVE